MGNSESSPAIEGTEGYHVLRVQDGSPGQIAGLEPFFDFIISIGNKRLDKDDETFKEILKQHVDRPLELTVYNSKSQTVRQTQIVPSNNWGGQGILGVSIRFCSFEGANHNVWHIISVQPNSPAAQAGLVGESDYVLGAESVLQQADDLISLVQANIGKVVKLFVYNVNYDNVREVSLVPNDQWGGEGCVGFDIGYGYLHRIPVSVDRSKPVENVANMPLLQDETLKPSIPQPGFTGIPQVDLIKQSPTAPVSGIPKDFPNPSEFLVNLSTVSSPLNPSFSSNISTPQVSLNQSFAAMSLPSSEQTQVVSSTQLPDTSIQTFKPAAEVSKSVSEAPIAQVGSNKPVFQPNATQQPAYNPNNYQTSTSQIDSFNGPPPAFNQLPNYYSPPTSQQAFSLPPQNVDQTFQAYEPRQSSVPPQLSQSMSAFASPTLNSTQASSFESPKSGIADYTQINSQSNSENNGAVPINTSTYQPYLAYGVPSSIVPTPGLQQFSSTASVQPPLPFTMPNYSLSNTFIPQQPPMSSNVPTNWSNPSALPPPIFNNLPMPSLSDLGIDAKELIPQPISNASVQLGQSPPSVLQANTTSF